MGYVYKPEDVVKGKKEVPDVKPTPIPRPLTPLDLGGLTEEVRLIKIEIEKIKRALRTHGIPVD